MFSLCANICCKSLYCHTCIANKMIFFVFLLLFRLLVYILYKMLCRKTLVDVCLVTDLTKWQETAVKLCRLLLTTRCSPVANCLWWVVVKTQIEWETLAVSKITSCLLYSALKNSTMKWKKYAWRAHYFLLRIPQCKLEGVHDLTNSDYMNKWVISDTAT